MLVRRFRDRDRDDHPRAGQELPDQGGADRVPRSHATGSDSKLSTFSDGAKVLSTIVELFRDYRPLLFFGGLAAILFAISAVMFWSPVRRVRQDWLRPQGSDAGRLHRAGHLGDALARVRRAAGLHPQPRAAVLRAGADRVRGVRRLAPRVTVALCARLVARGWRRWSGGVRPVMAP